jgi:hypothetical protein
MKIIIPVASAMSLLALSAQAQDATIGKPPGPGTPPPAGASQPMRKGPPPQQAARPAPPPGGQARATAGHAGPPPSHYVARGPVPSRHWGGDAYRGNLAWEGGRWRHERHNGRYGWWWDVGGVWYYYPERVAGPPTYISEQYVDDVPVVYAPPPAAYAPPPPAPADPGASALGGAIVGGVLGGLISGNATGAAAGAVLGGATGAIAGATAASQPGYYWSQGNCYYRYPNGQYVLADSRACY